MFRRSSRNSLSMIVRIGSIYAVNECRELMAARGRGARPACIVSCLYSDLSATTGSTAAARRAGSQLASAATPTTADVMTRATTGI